MGTEEAEKLEFNHIYIKHGVQKEPWFKNVCAVGLALGFIEPLESTGLLTTHENIMRLGDTLSRRQGKVTQFDIDGWNMQARIELENFKQFVSIHYGLSERDDTPYWQHVTSNIHYKKNHLEAEPEFTYSSFELMTTVNKTYELPSDLTDGKIFILTGMGINPISTQTANREAYRFPGVIDMWENVRKIQLKRNEELLEYINTLPTHYEFLRDNIYEKA
jgi:tryptophan halogenase